MSEVKKNLLPNGGSLLLADVPSIGSDGFREKIIAAVAEGSRIVALFAHGQPPRVQLTALLGRDRMGELEVLSSLVDKQYPALTPACAQAHLFEREIHEQYAVLPQGHPWLKPVRFHQPFPGFSAEDCPSIGLTDFFRVEGEEVHEVAVGPVHAGVIEPGHFRFQCHGENVFHLEISLGYQHRGIEQALLGGPHPRTLYQMETTAGDTSIGHTLAYCQLIEGMMNCEVPLRAQVLRGIALELERLANHTGDLGALAQDVGYLPTSAFCGRIRGDFLNMTALVCGSRFGRGWILPGGCGFDLDDHLLGQLRQRLQKAEKDVTVAANLLWKEPTVPVRFERVGVLKEEDCRALGIVGVASRASQVLRDVRHDYPLGVYRSYAVPVMTGVMGSVYDRAMVRWLEIQQSLEFISNMLGNLPEGEIRVPVRTLPGERLGVSLVEGWRGEICHVAITDAEGKFLRYKIVDPSFHNWIGLALALRGMQISDFPLTNKSFNLSYCGHDL